MPTLTWKDDYALAQPRMDDTHREFVDCLAAVEAKVGAAAADATAALQALLEHTEAHFGQEERWMAALGFEPENCHAMQHANVLQLLREVQRRHAAGPDDALLTQLVQALAEWFPAHALMMDAALAETMAARGFDPDTGQSRQARPADAATGCGSCG
jgi:hemerythrin